MSFDTQETWGAIIRQFLQELFGSRLTAHLEEEMLRLRNDYETRLHDKDIIIASLREEKAMLSSKINVYEMTIMPHASRAGADVIAYQKPKKPNFDFLDMGTVKSRWEQYQEDYYKEEAAREAAEKAARASEKESAATAKG